MKTISVGKTLVSSVVKRVLMNLEDTTVDVWNAVKSFRLNLLMWRGGPVSSALGYVRPDTTISIRYLPVSVARKCQENQANPKGKCIVHKLVL